MRGLMQDVPLTTDTIFRYAERHHGDVPIVSVVRGTSCINPRMGASCQ
jgi:hypothetical protein